MHTLPGRNQEELNSSPPELQVPFHRAPVGEEEVQAVSEVIRSGWLTMGPKTFEFEKEFAKYVGAQHAVAVSTGKFKPAMKCCCQQQLLRRQPRQSLTLAPGLCWLILMATR